MDRRWTWRLAAAAVVVAAAAWATVHYSQVAAPPPPAVGQLPSSTPPTSPASTGNAAATQDPARFAAQVVTHAASAGVSATLVMAILYNESYKPHDPQWERAWQKMKPDSAFGVANMHRAAFEETKRGRAFAGRDWQELPDDPDLAIQAAAWHLHDLAARLPAHPSSELTRDELMALGYNTGTSNMLAFAGGTRPGPQAQAYLDQLRGNWAMAGKAVQPR